MTTPAQQLELTHASFFSGVGGLDLGLESAGWQTVSFSEIDPYACAVLAERWPGVPNLGSIVDVAADGVRVAAGKSGRTPDLGVIPGGRRTDERRPAEWQRATLWTGGFPCQDLSIAGKRRGLDGARSGLAFAYLGLVERHRPPWVLLENVPGLLSSNRGRDFSVLLGRLSELGYGVAGRVLDARYFGVAQRRRRVFILASRDPGGRAGAERAAEVLSLAASGGGHPATSGQAGTGAAGGADDGLAHALQASAGHHGHSSPRGDGSDNLVLYNALAAFGDWSEARTVSRRDYKSSNHLVLDDGRSSSSHIAGTLRVGPATIKHGGPGDTVPILVRSSSDAGRDRATDGLAGRLDDRPDVGSYHQRDRVYADLAPALDAYGDTPSDAPMVWVKSHNVSATDGERWTDEPREARAVNGFDGSRTSLVASSVADDPLLPLGLDSHRYRCCGNGVVSNVAEAIGRALITVAFGAVTREEAS